MKSKTILIMMLALLILSPLAATTYYDRGSQTFNISVGTNVPLTISSYNNGNLNTGVGPGYNPPTTNQLMGGFCSINYEVFVHPFISIGAEIGYQFNYTQEQKIFTNVPILFKATYLPLQTGKWDIPISLGVGLDYMSYSGSSKLNMHLAFNIGVKYFITDDWGIGITSGISFTPELYSNSAKNGFVTYVPLNAVVTYRH